VKFLLAPAWVAQWAAILGHGALLLIDYGFPRREYYHPQRDAGTLMCHYRHHAHGEPFYLPGLQDITVHVDFTAIVEAGCEAGLDLLGYTTQSSFLFNCGLTEILARTPASDPMRYLPLANAAQKLVSPAEMGELFKVIALGKGISEPLLGFVNGDRSAAL
jgi:SAM-dependent MidA family methyltransferase